MQNWRSLGKSYKREKSLTPKVKRFASKTRSQLPTVREPPKSQKNDLKSWTPASPNQNYLTESPFTPFLFLAQTSAVTIKR